MKTKTILTILLALPLAFSSCSNEPESPANVDAGGGTGTDVKSKKADVKYPLTSCVVSGRDLGIMGDPIVYDHDGTTVKFCCKDCIPKFEKEPEKYLAKLKQTEASK